MLDGLVSPPPQTVLVIIVSDESKYYNIETGTSNMSPRKVKSLVRRSRTLRGSGVPETVSNWISKKCS